MLVVPAPVERVIDQEPGDLPGLGVFGPPEGFGGLDQQIGRFDVVAERVVRGDRAPVARQVEIEGSGLDGDLVADQVEGLVAVARARWRDRRPLTTQ